MSDWKETCAKCMDGDIEPLHCEYYGEPNGCNSPTYGEHKPVGNAAAIYAALVKIHDLTNALDEKCGVDPVEIRDIARSALSAPPRNCDCYDNEDEVESAYSEFRQREIDKIPIDALDYSKERGKIPGIIKWLLAPATERKGEGDGR